MSSVCTQLARTAQEYEAMQIVGSQCSAFDIYSTFKKIEASQRRLNFLCSLEGRREPQLIQKIHAEQRFIRRCYLKIYSSGIRLLQFGTLFIPHPVVKIGVDNTLNIIANSVLIDRELTTRTRELSWKAKAHQLFKLTTSIAGLVCGVLTIGYAGGLIDEDDSTYRAAAVSSCACTLAGVGYSILQTFKLVAERD